VDPMRVIWQYRFVSRLANPSDRLVSDLSQVRGYNTQFLLYPRPLS